MKGRKRPSLHTHTVPRAHKDCAVELGPQGAAPWISVLMQQGTE